MFFLDEGKCIFYKRGPEELKPENVRLMCETLKTSKNYPENSYIQRNVHDYRHKRTPVYATDVLKHTEIEREQNI